MKIFAIIGILLARIAEWFAVRYTANHAGRLEAVNEGLTDQLEKRAEYEKSIQENVVYRGRGRDGLIDRMRQHGTGNVGILPPSAAVQHPGVGSSGRGSEAATPGRDPAKNAP